MDPRLFYFCFVVDVHVRLRKDLSRPSRVYLFFAKEKGGERKKKEKRRLRYSGEVAAARDDKKKVVALLSGIRTFKGALLLDWKMFHSVA